MTAMSPRKKKEDSFIGVVRLTSICALVAIALIIYYLSTHTTK
jgi:hypothetical protein